MSELHPIDRAAMREIESGSETHAAWRRWCAANGLDADAPLRNVPPLPIRYLERGLLKLQPKFSIEKSSLAPLAVAEPEARQQLSDALKPLLTVPADKDEVAK